MARKVLIATDGSELAIDAARQGLALLDPGCDVTFMAAAYVPAVLAAPAAGMTGLPIDAIDDEAVPRARAAAEDAVQATMAATGTTTAAAVVVDGEPSEAICRYAGEGGFDLVVVGSHGSGVVKRVLLGSVSHHVLHHAPCPVLVVRPTPESGAAQT